MSTLSSLLSRSAIKCPGLKFLKSLLKRPVLHILEKFDHTVLFYDQYIFFKSSSSKHSWQAEVGFAGGQSGVDF